MYADRVFETSTTSGTSDFTLAGAVTAYRTFNAAFGTGVAFKYAIVHRTLNQWEVGEGSISLVSGNYVLARTTIHSSSNSNSKVNFSEGPKDVFNTLPANVMSSIATFPASDATKIVRGSADSSKELRFEVDGLPTATTAVVQVPRSVNLGDGGTFPERVHSHAQSDVTGLEDALAGKAAASHNHTSSQITDLVEIVQDIVAAMAANGSGISVSYNDAAGILTISATGGGGGGGSSTFTALTDIDITSAAIGDFFQIYQLSPTIRLRNEPFSVGALLPYTDTPSHYKNATDTTKQHRVRCDNIPASTTISHWIGRKNFDFRDFENHHAHRPQTAHSLDDNFDGTSLSGWTDRNINSGSYSVSDGCLKVVGPTLASGWNAQLITKTITTSNWSSALVANNWTITLDMELNAANGDANGIEQLTNYNLSGLWLGDGTKGILLNAQFNSGRSNPAGYHVPLLFQVLYMNSVTSQASEPLGVVIANNQRLRLVARKTGTTLRFGFILGEGDTVTWHSTTVTTTAHLASLTEVGICWDQPGPATYKTMSKFHSIRFNGAIS